MNVAIYPRKSKANDNSQSMEQQIADCTAYIKQHYPDAIIFVYGGDYALTGHSTEKRKDFQRMMNDVRAKRIQLVVIMRYDRIARNMRDFCNLYHDMEEAGCNLVSVSQQIDTSTPYGKNFMYQMASMAELEWAIISERYKDTAKYKREHGFAYTGMLPFGYKVEKTSEGKRVVKDSEKDAGYVFETYKRIRNKKHTAELMKERYPKFNVDTLNVMLRSDLYFGSVKGNDNFCEPYVTKEEMQELRSIVNLKYGVKRDDYPFAGLVACPYCGRTMFAYTPGPHRSRSYKCKYYHDHPHFQLTETKVESQMLARLEPILADKIIKAKVVHKNKIKTANELIKGLQAKQSRLNYMYENGRMTIEDYDFKYSAIESEIDKLKAEAPKDYGTIQAALPDNWKEIYNQLDYAHKKSFWTQIVKKIVLNTDKEVTDIVFNL